jgi:hypothetical protein
MDTPFRLVQSTVSHDTLKAAKQLTSDAESGDLLGFAITAIYRQGGYETYATGEAYKSPTFALGTVVVLMYKLIKMVVSRQKKSL